MHVESSHNFIAIINLSLISDAAGVNKKFLPSYRDCIHVVITTGATTLRYGNAHKFSSGNNFSQ